PPVAVAVLLRSELGEVDAVAAPPSPPGPPSTASKPGVPSTPLLPVTGTSAAQDGIEPDVEMSPISAAPPSNNTRRRNGVFMRMPLLTKHVTTLVDEVADDQMRAGDEIKKNRCRAQCGAIFKSPA